MTPEEFKAAMKSVNDEHWRDPEQLHICADNLMCKLLSELGYDEGVEIFMNMYVWYA